MIWGVSSDWWSKIPWPADGLLFPVVAPDACLCKDNREKKSSSFVSEYETTTSHVDKKTFLPLECVFIYSTKCTFTVEITKQVWTHSLASFPNRKSMMGSHAHTELQSVSVNMLEDSLCSVWGQTGWAVVIYNPCSCSGGTLSLL